MQRASSRVDMDTAEYSRTSSSDTRRLYPVMLVDNAVKEVPLANALQSSSDLASTALFLLCDGICEKKACEH